MHSIENADKNPKEILSWINDVNEVQKRKQPPSVVYSKPFPEIEQLMQVKHNHMVNFYYNVLYDRNGH